MLLQNPLSELPPYHCNKHISAADAAEPQPVTPQLLHLDPLLTHHLDKTAHFFPGEYQWSDDVHLWPSATLSCKPPEFPK